MKMVAASDNMKSRGQDLLVLLLFPVFFILHESNRYPGLVPAGVQLKLLATYALVVLIMYLVALVIMNDRVKAFLTSICLILFYFFFGSYHDVARDVFTGSRLSSYSVVLPFWLFLLSISILLIRFSRRSFGRLHIFAKMLLAVLVLLETVILLAGLLSGGWKKNFLAPEFPVNKTVMVADSLKPDIFYVVFDEHTSTRVLREQFGYDNSSLDAALRANGFYVAEQSTSNYNFTPFSLASTFSMDLLKLPAPDSILDMNMVLRGIHTARHNRLFPFLESQGYQFINYGFFDFPGLPSRGKPFFGNDYFEDVLGNQTIISRYNRDIRWYVASRNFLKGGSRVPPYFIRNKRDHIARHDAFFKGLKNELDREAGQPRFVYVHFLLPHQPFYQDSTGREVPHQVILKSSMTVEEGYLQQVGYVNRMLRQLAPSMVKPSARKRVVIIQGDHGYRLFDRTVSLEKVFSNLNAIYFSDGGYDQLHDSMSCVNTFRFVLNRYFRQDLAILRDSSRYFRDPEIEGRRKNLKN